MSVAASWLPAASCVVTVVVTPEVGFVPVQAYVPEAQAPLARQLAWIFEVQPPPGLKAAQTSFPVRPEPPVSVAVSESAKEPLLVFPL